MRLRTLLIVAATLVFSTLPALAVPGEASAVIQRCGTPLADTQGISPVSNTHQRNLTYPNDLILHFEPLLGGWSFTTAWHSHLPMTRSELEEKLPCFREAMADAAAAPQPEMDPTIAADQASVRHVDMFTFGVPHFWLIVLLSVALVILIALPSKRPEPRRVDERTYRRPAILGVPAPKPHVDPDLDQRS